MARLASICYMNMGQSPDSASYNENGEGIPFFQGNADFGEVNPKVRVWCNAPLKIAHEGDILISVRAPIGALNIADTTCCIGRGLAALTINESVCEKKYLWYAIASKVDELNTKGTGSTFKAISKIILAELEIPLPQKMKQQEIAAILDKITDLISLRKQQIAKLDELVKARFIEMFGDPNDEKSKWKKKPLGELCTIVRGGSPRPIEKFLGGKIPWIKIGDATQGDNIYLHSTREHIIEKGINKSRYIKSGSMIFANCGVSLGFARIITFDGCIHDGWLAFQDIDERLNDIFLLKALNMCTDYFRRTAPDGTQPNLNTAIMKSYLQIIPPIENQREFVCFSEHIDKSKIEIQKSFDKLETLKKVLMIKYFS